MAASKKSVKTSKTSHVLNVITGGSPADSAPAVEEGEQVALPTRERHPIPPILELARENDDAISNQILNALEEELKNSEEEEEEESPPVSDLIRELEPDTKKGQPEALPSQPEKRDDVLQPPAAAVEDEAEEEAEEEAIPLAPSEGKESPASDVMKCVNVMEKLVEEKALRYIKMIEVCSCSRCQADVKALCLTKLPAKYIVVHEDNMLMPMLTLYENKYASAITAQLVAACKTVKESPRHEWRQSKKAEA